MRRWLKRLQVSLAAALVLYHASAALLAGLWPSFRERLWPAVAFYADGLRMINTWGMFSRPPSKHEVRVVGVRADGTTRLLASSVSRGHDWPARVRDVRLRKIQSRLAKEDARREFGNVYLAYFCRQSRLSEVRLELVEAPLTNQPGQELMKRDCGAGEPDRQRSSGPRSPREDVE